MERSETFVVMGFVGRCVEMLAELSGPGGLVVKIARRLLIQRNGRRIRQDGRWLPVRPIVWNVRNIHADQSGRAGER